VTALHRAAERGDQALAELLIAQGADVNGTNEAGVTALHRAAGSGYWQVAELLIAQGAEVNARDNIGLTPLHWMAGLNNQTIAGFSILHRVSNNAPYPVRARALGCLAQNSQRYSIAFFYGQPIPMKLFSQFDRVVIEAENFNDFQKARLERAEIFAYISVGEAEDWRSVKPELKQNWILGTNKQWGNKIVDLTQQGWRDYLLKTRMASLWMIGYRAFFLDTIDSYQRVVKDNAGKINQENALIDFIHAIKKQFSGVRLLINRGFEVLPRIRHLVEGMIAESLFYSWHPTDRRYIATNDNDRFWLVKQLREVRDRHRLPVVVVDYLPPEHQEKAHQAARRIAELGFIPWITNHSLNRIYMDAAEQLHCLDAS
jgi:uncharacterized protein (TIGR01370 family)